MVVDIIVSLSLYKPLGIAGLVIGTLAANVVMTALQVHRLRIGFNGRLEGAQTVMITARILVASALLGAVSWVVWDAAERAARTARCPRRSSASGALPRPARWSTRARCSSCTSPRPTRSGA